jgi:hypothetical protein
MGLFGVPSLGAIVSSVAWLLMLGVGVLHSAGIAGTTIGYDEAMGITLCFFPIVLFVVLLLAVSTARAIGIAARIDDGD